MSAGPDQNDDQLWEARNQPGLWVVQSMKANGELLRLAGDHAWSLEAALRKAHELSPDGVGSMVITAATDDDNPVKTYGRQIWRLWHRLGLKAARSPSEEWADLAEDWRVKHDTMLNFPLYEGGTMKIELLPEYEALVEAERSAKARMDAFIAAHP
jgi:hypothetical protein